MKINIEGKTYEQLKFKGRALRNLLEIQDHLEEQQKSGIFKVEDFDIMTEFIANVFDNQFTSDDLLDGLELHEILAYFREISENIMIKTNDKMGMLVKK